MNARADLVIVGGGMAGMTLALQIRRRLPGISITVVERNQFPVPESAFKIGESTVEVAAHYFANVLGLAQHLEDAHLPKLGQRFFWGNGATTEIAARLEFGCRNFPAADTYQIARGRFENHLAELCSQERIQLLDGVRVLEAQVGSGTADHRVVYELGASPASVRCRWLVDATGGSSLLKRTLGLRREVEHGVSSAWFRVDRELKVDDWSSSPSWRDRHGSGPARRLSVNHLMGPGYWIWTIPLSTGATSVGLVADEGMHPVSGYNTFEKLTAWMERHEPQCAEVMRSAASDVMDFGVMKRFSRHATRVYSPDRWFVTGIAAVFVDPFYSPGSDFIAYGNTLISDLIVTDHAGGSAQDQRIEAANAFFLRLTDAYFEIFEGQYALFGNQKVMPLKVCWDWSSYWTYNAFAFCHGMFADLPHDPMAQRTLQAFGTLNHHMQRFFAAWGRAESSDAPMSEYINWTECDFLASLNERLVDRKFGVDPLAELQAGLVALSKAAGELVRAGVARVPELAEFIEHVGTPDGTPRYSYILDKVGAR